jgi:hypothetical protein
MLFNRIFKAGASQSGPAQSRKWVKAMQTKRLMPVPVVSTFAGDRSSYWFIKNAASYSATATPTNHLINIKVPLNCPHATTDWDASTEGTPFYPFWNRSRVLACVITIMFEPRPYVINDPNSYTTDQVEDVEVASRFNIGTTADIDVTDYPAHMAKLDSRWKIRAYAGNKAHKLIFKWRYGQQVIYDISDNVFTVSLNSTLPNELSFLHVLMGNDVQHDASRTPIPEYTVQAAYLLDNFDRIPNSL